MRSLARSESIVATDALPRGSSAGSSSTSRCTSSAVTVLTPRRLIARRAASMSRSVSVANASVVAPVPCSEVASTQTALRPGMGDTSGVVPLASCLNARVTVLGSASLTPNLTSATGRRLFPSLSASSRARSCLVENGSIPLRILPASPRSLFPPARAITWLAT